MKQLYRCVIRIPYYAYAESEQEARSYADAVLKDSYAAHDDTVAVVSDGYMVIADSWDYECLVYHDDEHEISVARALGREAMAKLEARRAATIAACSRLDRALKAADEAVARILP